MMTAQAATGTRWVQVGDLRIAYEVGGTGDLAVIFIPGIYQDRSYFTSQLAHCSGRWRAVGVDLRGHGASSPASEATLDDFAADVIAVAEDAGLDNVVLCGHSMGAAVALKVASARPGLVRGIAMLDGVVLFPEPARQAALTGLVPALATEHWLDALRGFFTTAILDPADPPDLRARVMADVGSGGPALARSFFADLFASDYAGELAAARCPILYLHGKVPSDLLRLAELQPGAVIERLPGSGHYLMLTVPDQVNAILDRFLDTVDASRTNRVPGS